jgi:hypothetical protein
LTAVASAEITADDRQYFGAAHAVDEHAIDDKVAAHDQQRMAAGVLGAGLEVASDV